MEEDKIEDLQKQIANMNRKLEKINEKTNRKIVKVEQKPVENEEKNIDETSKKITKTYDREKRDQIEHLNQKFRELKDETTQENDKMIKRLTQIDDGLNRIEQMIQQISPGKKFEYLDPMDENLELTPSPVLLQQTMPGIETEEQTHN